LVPGKNILIVEEEASRQVLALLLEARGHSVRGAANGQQALDLLRAGPPPDLILLDLMMPVLSGWAFRQAQVADPALARIPVIVLSAVGDVAQQADILGEVGYLTKPVEPGEVLEAIERFARPRKPEVLIVEGEVALLTLLEKVLRHYGFAPRLAAGGLEAVTVYERHKDSVDVVLLDVHMPGVDGLQTLAALRRINPGVRAALMTGDPGGCSPEEVGVEAPYVFGKPFTSLAEVARGLWRLAAV
jgi:CheY-like chemotaxis protein